MGAATRLTERRAGGQTVRPESSLSNPHPSRAPSYVTGDLAFPSDGARANDGHVRIHNYTTPSLSGFLAAQQNNSRPLCLRHTRGSCGNRFYVAVLHWPSSNKQAYLVCCDYICSIYQEHCDAALDTRCMNATPPDHR